MRARLIGVAGAGVMGRDIAQALLTADFNVLLCDVSADAAEAARAAVKAGLRRHKLVNADPRPTTGLLSRLTVSGELAALAQADLVIENTTEDFEVKRAVYAQLDRICRTETVFAVNTSTFPVDEIASLTDRPDRVVGAHFMNPAHSKPTVEIIRGARTSNVTLEMLIEVLGRMNKKGVVVNDAPGFVTNRVLMLTINEAIRVVESEVADAGTVDLLFQECFGHAMGPLATADLVGLDTILLSLRSLQQRLDPHHFEPSALLIRMVAEGRHGRKSGKGFFDYSPGGAGG
jgi:3-hydroxybutyryl-CoA dehydrogenase